MKKYLFILNLLLGLFNGRKLKARRLNNKHKQVKKTKKIKH